jgi:hypothetical protein
MLENYIGKAPQPIEQTNVEVSREEREARIKELLNK